MGRENIGSIIDSIGILRGFPMGLQKALSNVIWPEYAECVVYFDYFTSQALLQAVIVFIE